MSVRPSIEEVWRRIESLEGERFHTITGKSFSYIINGNVLRTNRAAQDFSLSEFNKALQLVPLSGPGQINSIVRGPAYIWAILHDRRIRQGDW